MALIYFGADLSGRLTCCRVLIWGRISLIRAGSRGLSFIACRAREAARQPGRQEAFARLEPWENRGGGRRAQEVRWSAGSGLLVGVAQALSCWAWVRSVMAAAADEEGKWLARVGQDVCASLAG